MAQETRVAPIQLNDDASKILMNLGDTLSKQNMQQAQLEGERAKYKQQVERQNNSDINEYTEHFQKNVSDLKPNPKEADSALKLMQLQAALALKHKMSPADLRSKMDDVFRVLSTSTNTKNAVATQASTLVKENKDVDESRLTQHIQDNVYGTADKKPVDPSTTNYALDAVNPSKNKLFYKLYNPDAALDTTKKFVQDGKDKQTFTSEFGGQIGLVRTMKGDKISIDPTYYTVTSKGPQMITDEHGLLGTRPYQELIANTSANAYLSQRADDFVSHWNDTNLTNAQRMKWMKDNGITEEELRLDAKGGGKIIDPSNPETFETIKRAFATDFVQRHSPITVNGKEVTTIVNNNGGNGQNQVDNDSLPVHPWDRIQEVLKGNKEYIKSSGKANNGKITNDVTDQFSAFKIADDDEGNPVLPDKVTTNSGRFHIYLNGKEMKSSYSPETFNDLINARTPGVNYAKPKNTFKNIKHSGKGNSTPDASGLN